jgi:hypothetical protein
MSVWKRQLTQNMVKQAEHLMCGVILEGWPTWAFAANHQGWHSELIITKSEAFSVADRDRSFQSGPDWTEGFRSLVRSGAPD